MGLIPSAVTLGAGIAVAVLPSLQTALVHHSKIAAVIGVIYGIALHIAPSPLAKKAAKQ